MSGASLWCGMGAVTIEGVGILDRRVEITSVFLSLPTQHLLSDRYANFLWYFNSPAALPDYWVVRSPTVRLLLDGPLLNLTLSSTRNSSISHRTQPPVAIIYRLCNETTDDG